MRSVQDIAKYLLSYTDLGEGDPLSCASETQKAFLCSVITGALQEVHSIKPEAFRGRLGFTLAAPESGTAVVTAGSTSVDLSSWGNKDLRGRTFRMGSALNQIAPSESAPGNAFILPWDGMSGTAGISVYGDAILIGSDAFSVMGDVHLEGYGPLRPCPDRSTYTAYRDELWGLDYGLRPYAMTVTRNTGIPESWWTETACLPTGHTQLYLRFAPLPEREYQVSFDVAYCPREISTNDLEGSIPLPVPGRFFDGILIPYALQRWTGSPWFRNAEAREEIARQYKTAERMLFDWRAQEQTGTQAVVLTR